MASKIGLGYRREHAMARLRPAMAALAGRFGLDVAFPEHDRDADALAVRQLEAWADLAEGIASAFAGVSLDEVEVLDAAALIEAASTLIAAAPEQATEAAVANLHALGAVLGCEVREPVGGFVPAVKDPAPPVLFGDDGPETITVPDGAVAVPAAAVPPLIAAALMAKMSRADLDAYAAERGIDAPETLPNKDAVIAAIEASALAAQPDPDAP